MEPKLMSGTTTGGHSPSSTSSSSPASSPAVVPSSTSPSHHPATMVPVMHPLHQLPPITAVTSVSEDGLILPRKILNPCLESRERVDLHRELRFNAKAGINVLDQKSELTKVLEKRQAAAKLKEKQAADSVTRLQRKSSFERKLEEQAVKILNAENEAKSQSSSTSSEHNNNLSKGSHDAEAEFRRIHAKIYEKKQQLASSS